MLARLVRVQSSATGLRFGAPRRRRVWKGPPCSAIQAHCTQFNLVGRVSARSERASKREARCLTAPSSTMRARSSSTSAQTQRPHMSSTTTLV